jgi:nitrogen fixation NifU-like protein
MTTEIVKGRSVEEALRLEPEDLILILGGLPEGKEECARMAVHALRDALGDRRQN